MLFESGPEHLARLEREKNGGTLEAKVVEKRLSPKEIKAAKEKLFEQAKEEGIDLDITKSLKKMQEAYEKESDE